MTTDAENIGQFWAELIIEELLRNGVTQFCLSPGSRSSPLAVAIARCGSTRSVVHFDERGSSFFALGWARATGSPAAVVTTSGTAAANCLPAVVEASVDGVPMLLLTADRPPELREAGANQTIRQVGLYGDYVRWSFDLPVPSLGIDPTFVLTTVDHAVQRSVDDRGPVHLNCMFREPLAPVSTTKAELPVNIPLGRWLDRDGPYTRYHRTERLPSQAQTDSVLEAIGRARNGVIIAGRLAGRDDGRLVFELARRLRWPVLCDVLSNVNGSPEEGIVRHVTLLFKSMHFRSTFKPDCILHLGSRATSKELYKHLTQHIADDFILVAPSRARIDPTHRVTTRIESEVAAVCSALLDRIDTRQVSNPSGLTAPLDTIAHRTDQIIESSMHERDEISELIVAHLVTQLTPPENDLFLAASMPIRDADMFGTVLAGGRCCANRGASGIDGTVASAVGYACGSGRPVTLIVGDLALLHDLNSLQLAGSSEQPITIVVVNNDGGGVFSFLAISELESVYEKFFAAPHGRSFEGAAAMFGLHYLNPQTGADFRRDLEAVAALGRSTVIEVTTSRSRNKEQHLEIYKAVDTLVGRVTSPLPGS